MFKDTKELLISVYNSDNRIFVFKTRFGKFFTYVVLLLVFLILTTALSVLYFIQHNRGFVNFSQISYKKTTVDIQDISLSSLEKGVSVDFSVNKSSELVLRVIILGIRAEHIVSNVPLFDIYDVFRNNLCTQGEVLNMTNSMIQKVNFSLNYGTLDGFDRLILFVCDKTGKLAPFYREFNIASWSNNNAIR